MVADALTRTPWWARRRLLAGLAALALASSLGAWSTGSVGSAGSAAAVPDPAPVTVAAASIPADPTATATQRSVAGVPAPVGEPAAGRATHASRWNTTDEPTGGSHPRAVGQRAPPAARA